MIYYKMNIVTIRGHLSIEAKEHLARNHNNEIGLTYGKA